ncbi:MAG: helix-turn-helix domain-containing protein [Solirubrobacteraceae bacterium]
MDSTIKVFEAEPRLLRFLPEHERELAIATTVPSCNLDDGEIDLRALLVRHRAFGALVLDGMLIRELRIGEHTGLWLLSAGDLVSLSSATLSIQSLEPSCYVSGPTRLAMLGADILLAARRWPRLVAGLSALNIEQNERLAAHMMICQLPRVEDRLLAMMWLLADSWGHVTAAGRLLPLALTHKTLGDLIGARRPTVSLATRVLTDNGSIVRLDRGWLLLKRPQGAARKPGRRLDPPHVIPGLTEWSEGIADVGGGSSGEALASTVERLRAECLHNAAGLQDRLARWESSRAELTERRMRFEEDRAERRFRSRRRAAVKS